MLWAPLGENPGVGSGGRRQGASGPPAGRGYRAGWYFFIYGRRKLHEDGSFVFFPAVPQCREHSMPSTNESRRDSGQGARPVLAGAQVLTLQPAEEIVGLEDRLGSQRAHQDGLTAQEVVHGARIERSV